VVDKVYKKNIPSLRKAIEQLRKQFSSIKSKTDWTKLRIQPLLQHAKQLELQLKTQGTARLNRGVRMFHSDLVYLQQNVNGLKVVLASEKKRLQGKIKPRKKGAR
jgi:hypothetical protein